MKMLIAAAVLALSSPAVARDMPGAAPSTAAAEAQGTGVIKKLDPKAGSVTLQHGPIAALGWPAMTMPFKIDPALLKDLKVGQTVSFAVKPGPDPEISAIQPK